MSYCCSVSPIGQRVDRRADVSSTVREKESIENILSSVCLSVYHLSFISIYPSSVYVSISLKVGI